MVDIVKLKISGSNTKNTKLAPETILNQLKNVWGSETGRITDDYAIYDWENWQNQAVNRTLFLGGDHSATALTFLKTKASRLIVLDAHFDLYGPGQRLFHGNWLKLLLEKGIITPEKIMVLGVRAWDRTELEYAKSKGIDFFPFNEIPNFKPFTEPTYLNLDIDVVDPAFAPGTGYTEPGGWSSRQLLELVKTLRQNNLVAMDIVEVDPSRDLNDMTSKLAAKVIKEFL